MAQRGKTAAALKNVATLAPQLIKPPTGTAAAFKKRWRTIVNGWPADFFMTSDIPMITSYINNELTLKELYEILDDIPGDLVKTKTGYKIHAARLAVNDLLRIQMALAVKLRLSPSCRDQLIKRGTLKQKEAPNNSTRPMFAG